MKTVWILALAGILAGGANAARAVEIRTAPLDRTAAAPPGETKPVTVGPREPAKERGVKVNLFLSRNVAVSSSISLLSAEEFHQPGAVDAGSDLSLRAAQVGGTIGLKVFFN